MMPLYVLLILLFVTICFTIYGFTIVKIHSIAFFFSIAMITQVLIPAFALLWVDEFRFPLDPDVITPLLQAYGLYMSLSLPFLFLLILLYKKFVRPEIMDNNEQLNVHPFFIYTLVVISVAETGVLIMDGEVSFLFQTLTSGNLLADDYKLLRVQIIEEGFKNYQTSSIFNYIKFILSSGTVFGFFLFLYVYSTRKQFLIEQLPLFILIVFNMFVISFKGFEKGPILLFLAISLMILLRNRIKNIAAFKIIAFFIFGNLLVTQIMSLTTGLSYGEAFLFLYFRIFVEPTVGAYMHFSVFPSQVDFVHFSNMGLIRRLFNLPEVLSTGSIAIDTAKEFTGLYYSANANIVPTGWAQFGRLGIIIYTGITFLSFIAVDLHSYLMGGVNSRKMLNYFYGYFILYFANTSFENFLFASCFFLWPIILPYILIVHSKNQAA